MNHTADTLMATFRLTDYLVPMALEDLTDEDARKRSRGDEGPSIAWLVGHMLHYRLHVMGLLGEERPDPWKERFADTEATDGSDYPTVVELREAWDEVAADFAEAMASKTDADFERPVEGPHDEETLRDQLVFYAWHEGYHMGAVGAQLKRLGYLGPAEKVMASRLAKFDA
ncbi:MAG: DinB family protein [Gemmatimonadota bacterium]